MQNIQQVLLHAHLEEIARKDAAAWNIGWYRSVNRIESKTDKGILVSKRSESGFFWVEKTIVKGRPDRESGPHRVRPRSSPTQTKLSEHEANRGEAEKSECVSVEVFEILGQPAAAIEPSESALDNPTSRQKRKPFGLVGAFDDFDLDVRQDFG